MISAIALGGVTADGEPVATLSLEAPLKVPFGGRRLTKSELERVHLEKYRLDVLNATGVLPFDRVARGDNPPDFVVETPSGREGIECAAFTLQKRRDAFGLFERFQRRVLDAARREPFPHLADCVVGVRFGNGLELPPKAQDQDTVERFIETLRTARVDRAAAAAFSDEVSRTGFPDRLPPDVMPDFSAGDAGDVQVNVVAPHSLTSEFAQSAGFDVHLNMSIAVTSSDVQAEVERLVRNHDKKGVNRLLISVGAPDRRGLIYPTETYVVERLPLEPVQTQHIRVLTFHNYLTGAIGDLA